MSGKLFYFSEDITVIVITLIFNAAHAWTLEVVKKEKITSQWSPA